MKTTRQMHWVLVVCSLFCGLWLLNQSQTGCAPELLTEKSTQPDGSAGADETGGPPEVKKVDGEAVVTQDLGGGVTGVTVNSSDNESWVYFSFAANGQVKPEDAMSSNEWALGFQRFNIKSNGGVSGSRGVEVAIVDGKTFSEVTAAPTEGWITDQPDGDDQNTDPDYAFSVQDAWYIYNVRDHTLTPRKRVYVVKVGDDVYKVELQGYYDSNGNSGFPAFRWAKL